MSKSSSIELYNFDIIHGRELCSEILTYHQDKLKTQKIHVSSDIKICTVINHPLFGNPIQSVLLDNKVDFLVVKTYTKWITKIETLMEYIKTNYNKLPKYLLYLDGYDTMILNDIPYPDKILDFYKCKILFNVEPYYRGTGYIPPTPSYMGTYEKYRREYILLNTIKYGSPIDFGINAGVFLGEKEHVLYILEETFNLMMGDISKGFPYGCSDDQYVLRYVHNKHFDIISGDVFNLFSFWGGSFSFKDFPSEEIYHIGYSNKFLEIYLNKEK